MFAGPLGAGGAELYIEPAGPFGAPATGDRLVGCVDTLDAL